MALKQIDHGTADYDQMVALRDQILRKPLGLSFSNEELAAEHGDILIACTDDDEMLGCCILTPQKQRGLVRLRQMAVPLKLHGKGIGQSVLQFAETLARDKGYNKITMHARDTAIGFYEKAGYKITGDEFTELNIPHHIMEKTLI